MTKAERENDLKRRGYPVSSRMVQRRNRYGRLCRVAEYYLDFIWVKPFHMFCEVEKHAR